MRNDERVDDVGKATSRTAQRGRGAGRLPPGYRADKTAILSGQRALSYGQLAEAVNRFGNVLGELGVRLEERVALLLPDSPEWVMAFFGAIKSGRGRRAAQHAADEQGLRVSAERLPRARARGACRLARPHLPIRERLCRLEHVIVVGVGRTEGSRHTPPCAVADSNTHTPCAERGRHTECACYFGLRRPHGPRVSLPRAGGHAPRRRGVLALQFRHDRLSQRRGPPAARHARGRRRLRPRHDPTARNRRLVLGGQAVLRLRAGQRAVLSAADRRHDRAHARAAHARKRLRRDRPLSADRVLRRAHQLRRPAARGRGGGPHEPGPRADVRLGRRDAAAAHLRALARAVRRRDPRRHRLDRNPAHLHFQPARRGQGGQHRPGRARLRGPDRRRRRPRSAARPGRHAA